MTLRKYYCNIFSLTSHVWLFPISNACPFSNNSPTPTGCPIIQFWRFVKLVQASQVKGSPLKSVPILQASQKMGYYATPTSDWLTDRIQESVLLTLSVYHKGYSGETDKWMIRIRQGMVVGRSFLSLSRCSTATVLAPWCVRLLCHLRFYICSHYIGRYTWFNHWPLVIPVSL